MHSFPLVAREITTDGIVICRVQDGQRLGLVGYHLYVEDEQKNPYFIVLKDGSKNLVCIPTSPSPAPVGVFFSSPLYLSVGASLVAAVTAPIKMLPARIWGTVWLV